MIMLNPVIDTKVIEKFGPYTLPIGILLIVLGALGILLPALMAFSTAIFVGWILLVGGVLWATHTYQHCPTHVMGRIKPLLLIITGSLMLFYPSGGVQVVGLLLAVYLLFDTLGSFILAQSVHPAKGWGWMLINGVMSMLLAALLLISWPVTSLWLVGLYVGINLLFDGMALVAIGWSLHKTSTNTSS
jgi:membrane protein HdeD